MARKNSLEGRNLGRNLERNQAHVANNGRYIFKTLKLSYITSRER